MEYLISSEIYFVGSMLDDEGLEKRSWNLILTSEMENFMKIHLVFPQKYLFESHYSYH